MELSASGKVILLGEHAVVYGHPALAGALAAGARVSLRREGTGLLEVPAWSARFSPAADDDARPVAQAAAGCRLAARTMRGNLRSCPVGSPRPRPRGRDRCRIRRVWSR